MGEPAIAVEHVSKRFRIAHGRPNTLKERIITRRRTRSEEFYALRDVSLDVFEGDTMGLIGANGSGKSTLLKCIAGILRPDDGAVRSSRRIASLLELGAGFHPDLTGRENIYLNASILGLTRRETDGHLDEIIEFAELEQFIDTQVKHYSSGMYVRLGFAVAVHVDPEILLVDEVLAVGDEAFQRKCLDRIRRFQREGRTIVFVTHALDMVREVCTTAAFLHHGHLELMGTPAEAVREYRVTVHGEAHTDARPLEERGNREISILRVSLQDGRGTERSSFTAGDTIEVVLDLESVRRIDDWVIGVGVHGDRDLPVFGTNTLLESMQLEPIDGKRRVRFTFAGVPLQNGTYYVTVGVVSADQRIVYHWHEKAYTFHAVNVGPSWGIIGVGRSIAVDPL